MSFEDWAKLAGEKQEELCQSLDPYKEWSLFKQVEVAFLNQHGSQSGITHVFCGFGSGLGPINAITVTVNRNLQVKLPKHFMGFPVFRKPI